MKNRPIGVFDSGVGGGSVLSHLVQRFPLESFLYFADTKNAPYGEKSPKEIAQFLQEGISFLESKTKAIVIACHTASLFLPQVRCHIPCVGMVEASLRACQEAKGIGRLALLGTTRTIESGVYQKLINRPLIEVPCPLFFSLVEGDCSEKEKEEVVEKTLQFVRGKVDGALLACTHYPFLRREIHKGLGESVQLIDPSAQVAEEIASLLMPQSLQETPFLPKIAIHTTGDPFPVEKNTLLKGYLG